MIVTVLGARPQFIKAAMLSRALADVGIQEHIIHTGQHYDHVMSDVFWSELGLPPVAVNLDVGSGPHGWQTGAMLAGVEQELHRVDSAVRGVLVYGDTNSTLAGALAAAKLGIDVYHVEAGLRSFDRQMPEEINRVLTDRLSHALFCPSATAVTRLAREGITERVYDVGDVMCDAVSHYAQHARQRFTRADLPDIGPHSFAVLTMHRAANTEDPVRMQAILDAVGELEMRVLWPVHPRVRAFLERLVIPANLVTSAPLSYLQMLFAMQECEVVITDSGGLQKEAYWLKRRCLTMRAETEWVETLEGDWNQLVNAEPGRLSQALNRRPSTQWEPLYGTGAAAREIALTLKALI